MFIHKIYNQDSETMIAIADKELIGKTIEHNDLHIEVNDFYNGDEINKVTELIENATIVNALGNNIVQLLIKNGHVKKENTIKLGNILHAQIIKV